MRRWRRSCSGFLAVLLLLTMAVVNGASAAEQDQGRYTLVTIRGKLTEPRTGEPMVGAMVRFVSTAENGGSVEGKTNDKGEFFLENLGYSTYAVSIETASGEHIRGINELPIVEGKPVSVILKVSERPISTMELENKPERILIAIIPNPPKWRRFWAEFGVFMGAAVGLGLAGN